MNKVWPHSTQSWLPIANMYIYYVVAFLLFPPYILHVLHTWLMPICSLYLGYTHTQCMRTQSTLLYICPVHLHTAALAFTTQLALQCSTTEFATEMFWRSTTVAILPCNVPSTNCCNASIDCRCAWNLTYALTLPLITLRRLLAIQDWYFVTDTLTLLMNIICNIKLICSEHSVHIHYV